MKAKWTGVLAVILTMAGGAPAWALNGALLTGFSARHESLGGAGAGRAVDTTALLVNPAGLTQLPREVDFNVLLAWPKSQMNSSAAPAGNAAGLVTSNDDPIILPGGGFAWPTSLLDHRIFFGMAMVPVAGFSLDYPSSRLTAALTANAFDTHTSFGVLKIVPSAAWKINDQWSVGLAFHLNHATFETNSAIPGVLTETAGGDRGDGAFGFGVGVGVTYHPMDWITLGLSYTTEQWMQNFERYADVLPSGLNLPQQIRVGASFEPLDRFYIMTDWSWINWSGAGGGFGTSVAAGGLGWRDQFVGMLGLEYEPVSIVRLRLGYNYGRAPIPSGSVFASQLASPIGEHHFGAGVGLSLGEKLRLDLSYLHTLSKTVTDDGTQGGGLGIGSFTRQSVNQMNTEVSLLF